MVAKTILGISSNSPLEQPEKDGGIVVPSQTTFLLGVAFVAVCHHHNASLTSDCSSWQFTITVTTIAITRSLRTFAVTITHALSLCVARPFRFADRCSCLHIVNTITRSLSLLIAARYDLSASPQPVLSCTSLPPSSVLFRSSGLITHHLSLRPHFAIFATYIYPLIPPVNYRHRCPPLPVLSHHHCHLPCHSLPAPFHSSLHSVIRITPYANTQRSCRD